MAWRGMAWHGIGIGIGMAMAWVLECYARSGGRSLSRIASHSCGSRLKAFDQASLRRHPAKPLPLQLSQPRRPSIFKLTSLPCGSSATALRAVRCFQLCHCSKHSINPPPVQQTKPIRHNVSCIGGAGLLNALTSPRLVDWSYGNKLQKLIRHNLGKPEIGSSGNADGHLDLSMSSL